MAPGDSDTPIYDAIGGHYQDVKALPSALPEYATVLAACGDVTGLDVLDLACGTGYYTRALRCAGARRVQGIDVSTAMIDSARQAEIAAPLGIDYRVHDAANLPELGSFDLVTGVWLLNYAADEGTLAAMLRSVRRTLAPEGRFVGVTQNPWFTFDRPQSDKYGWTFEPLAHTDFSTQVHATAHTTPPVRFPAQFACPDAYARCAFAAGLDEFEWRPLVIPQAARERFDTGFWADFEANPYLAVFVTHPREEAS